MIKIYQGDCNQIMPTLKEDSVDLICTCYDKDTQILTKNGWKYFFEVTLNDDIATLSGNGYLEYQHPYNITSSKYNGNMFKLTTPFIDIKVTPNHNLYLRKQSKKEFELIRASKAPFYAEYKTNAKWKGKELENYIINGSIRKKEPLELKTKDFIEFLGYFISKGCSSGKSINLMTQSETMMDLFLNSIKRIGFNPTIDKQNDKYNVRFYDCRLHSYLKKIGKKNNRYIPSDILELDKPYLEILLQAMMNGYTNEKRKYWTSSLKLRDNIQELLLKVGYSGVFSIDKTKGTIRKWNNITFRNNNDVWCIGINKNKTTPSIQPNNWKNGNSCFIGWQQYNDYVYCVSVPNQIIYVRREGKPYWCGNSPPYNLNMSYNTYNDNLSYNNYLSFLKTTFTNCYRILKWYGRICINVPNVNSKGERHFTISEIDMIMKDIGYVYRNNVVWHKQNCSKRTAWGSWMSPSNPYMVEPYEFVLIYSKKLLQNKPYGRISDITKEEFITYTNSLWNITPETRIKEHPAPFPEELVSRLIKFYSYVGDTILDPFLGSGTTCVCAKKLNREGIGIETDSKYIELACNRLNNECEIIK